jgi:hypothetical protein
MIPGPDQIIACPKCKGLAKYMTLITGNTFGAVVWTDGKQVAPMMPGPPPVVKCRHCSEFYWLSDAKEVGEWDRHGDHAEEENPDWATVETVEEPGEDEYYLAIEKNLAKDPDQEKFLRVLAWWRRNDAYRHSPRKRAKTPLRMSDPCRKNLKALAGLLGESNNNDLIMKAEVLRELGEFNSAKDILAPIDTKELIEAVHQLQSLCDARDSRIRELKFKE